MLGLVKALGTTMRAAFRKPVTVSYPTEKKVLPHRARGFPVLLWDFEKDEQGLNSICRMHSVGGYSVTECEVTCATEEVIRIIE